MFKSIKAATSRRRDVLNVVAVPVGRTSAPPGLDAATRKAVAGVLKGPAFSARMGESLPVGNELIVLGLGETDEIDTERLRTIGGRLVRVLDERAPKAVEIAITDAVHGLDVTAEAAGEALGVGMGVANWRVDEFDGSASETAAVHGSLSVSLDEAEMQKGLRRGLILAECTNEARRVAATPPNLCTPDWIARESRRLARREGLTCRVITYTQAQDHGMGGLVNVGRGSKHKPCLVVLEHKPAKRRAGVKVALVGKTVTFDTGGYSIKPSKGMRGMKYDKCGGCAVLGAMLAISRLKLPVHVVALLPAAENMVSDDAYRPDDIIEMYGGTTVEVTNTDAEGRLVLADALAYACKRLKPTVIVDAATLTGGVVVALGAWCAGVFCNDDELLERLDRAADTTGERIWRLPLWDDHRDFMRAKHADLWNSGPKRDGHPIQGAAFLSFFVDDDIPWAHLDIAGMASVESDGDLFVTGPTGYGVRLLTELVSSYQ